MYTYIRFASVGKKKASTDNASSKHKTSVTRTNLLCDIEYIQMDARKMSFNDGDFDFIVDKGAAFAHFIHTYAHTYTY